MNALARFLRERWALAVGPLVLLGLWEALSRIGAIPMTFFPPPTRIIANAGIILDLETGLGGDILATIGRLVGTVALAVLIGVGLGIAITASQWTERGVGTLLSFVYPIPGVLFFPFLTFVLGRSETAVLLTALVTPLIVMILYTVAGVHSINRTLIEVADNYDCRGARRFFRVFLPGALPSIVTGIRISLGFGLIAVIAIEMVGAPSGLGNFLWENWQTLRVTDMYVALLCIAVLGLLTTVGFDALADRLLPWRADARKTS
ncbi:taurine ABC transporter permease [Pseudoclavibacter endophyticus]|uniref:ABC transporter permease n=1 Tax=Pseudoclavibacter endophyticus TaxID=1778590 RepID=A0A6H9WF04_9MICO|nr:ABC transporter permease [Pseudoclavibacter endophyticus]KAB1646698.1 ABC transporter permease [Pseudoclavibacter endophyticus]GGA76317.1 taurine ABC transporter permease [Pseudoclavibacter endophyticus]